MNNLKHAMVPGLAILGLVLLGAPVLRGAEGEGSAARWQELSTVAPGSRVRVVMKNVESWEGTLRAVSDDGVTVQTASGEKTFARNDVLRVSAKGTSHRKRNLLIGLGTGAATGAIVAVADPKLGQGTCEQGSCVNAGTVALATLVGAAVGSGACAAIPTGGWHEVYRAPAEVAERHGRTTAGQHAALPASGLTAGQFIHR